MEKKKVPEIQGMDEVIGTEKRNLNEVKYTLKSIYTWANAKQTLSHTHTQTVNIYHLSEKKIKNIRILIKEVGHS